MGVSAKEIKAWLRTPAAVVAVISAALLLLNAVFSFTVAASQDADVSLIKFRKSQSGDWRDLDPILMFSKALEDIESFRNRLPDESGVNKTLAALYGEGRKAGLDIAKGSYRSEPLRKAGISRYSVTLPVVGSYASIKRFIGYIEADKGVVVIEDISLAKGSSSDSSITIQLSLSAYYR